MNRLQRLSQPKPKVYASEKDDDEEDSVDEDQREEDFRLQAEKKGGVDFANYLDRDVPYIKNS